MLVGFAGTGLLTIVAAADLGLPWTIAGIALSGLCTGPSTAAMLLLRKQQSPSTVRSQVFTVASGLRVTASAAGAAIAGLAAGLDAGDLIAVIGLIWMVSALVMLGYPRGAEPHRGVSALSPAGSSVLRRPVVELDAQLVRGAQREVRVAHHLAPEHDGVGLAALDDGGGLRRPR